MWAKISLSNSWLDGTLDLAPFLLFRENSRERTRICSWLHSRIRALVSVLSSDTNALWVLTADALKDITEQEIYQPLSLEELLEGNITLDDQAAPSKAGSSTAEQSMKGLSEGQLYKCSTEDSASDQLVKERVKSQEEEGNSLKSLSQSSSLKNLSLPFWKIFYVNIVLN